MLFITPPVFQFTTSGGTSFQVLSPCFLEYTPTSVGIEGSGEAADVAAAGAGVSAASALEGSIITSITLSFTLAVLSCRSSSGDKSNACPFFLIFPMITLLLSPACDNLMTLSTVNPFAGTGAAAGGVAWVCDAASGDVVCVCAIAGASAAIRNVEKNNNRPAEQNLVMTSGSSVRGSRKFGTEHYRANGSLTVKLRQAFSA